MKWKADDYVDINNIATNSSESICNPLIGIHSFTGCDTVETFSNISKAMWIRSFLNNDADIIKSLSQMPLAVTESVFVHIYSRQIGYNEDLSALRYRLFRKISANTEKLPPTRGALIQHLYRSHVQARRGDTLNEVDPLEYGFRLDGTTYFAFGTEDPIAPNSVIDMTG